LFLRGFSKFDGIDISAIVYKKNTAADNIASTVYSYTDQTVSEITSAVYYSIQSEIDKLKSQILQYYSVNLWNYCKSEYISYIICSNLYLKFVFDFLSIFGNTESEIDQLLEKINKITISNFRYIFYIIIILYLSGFVATVLVVVLGIQKTFYNRDYRLLSICSPVNRNSDNIYSVTIDNWYLLILGCSDCGCYRYNNYCI